MTVFHKVSIGRGILFKLFESINATYLYDSAIILVRQQFTLLSDWSKECVCLLDAIDLAVQSEALRGHVGLDLTQSEFEKPKDFGALGFVVALPHALMRRRGSFSSLRVRARVSRVLPLEVSVRTGFSLRFSRRSFRCSFLCASTAALSATARTGRFVWIDIKSYPADDVPQ